MKSDKIVGAMFYATLLAITITVVLFGLMIAVEVGRALERRDMAEKPHEAHVAACRDSMKELQQ